MKSISRKIVFRRIVKLLDGGNALKLPLVELECGHQTRTKGIRKTKCPECGKEQLK